jgi:hypothetical protein
MQTPVFEIAHLFGIRILEHLVHEAIILKDSIVYIFTYKSVLVLGKDLFEDIPGRWCFCSHDATSLRGVGFLLWYHNHTVDVTTPNVYRGMAGFYLLFDDLDSGDA